MSTFIMLPNGDGVSNAVIRTVSYVKDRGVLCGDAQRRPVVWIEVSDVEKAHRVRDIMNKFVQDRRGIPQPDWAFLKEKKDPSANS